MFRNFDPFNGFHRFIATILVLLMLALGTFILVVLFPPKPIKDPKLISAFQQQGRAYQEYIAKVKSEGVSIDDALALVNSFLQQQQLPIGTAVPGQPTQTPDTTADSQYSSARSKTILAPYIKSFFETAPKDPYWAEPGMNAVECVGLIKRYQHEVLGLNFRYLSSHNEDYMTWAADVGNGWPNYSIKVYLDGKPSIFDPNPPPGKDVITFPDGKKYKFHVVAIPPSMKNQLEFGDILIFGSLQDAYNGVAGHTGLFAAYPNGPDGDKIMMLDENGGKGSETAIPEDAIQFHSFNKSWLSDQAIALRVIIDEEVH